MELKFLHCRQLSSAFTMEWSNLGLKMRSKSLSFVRSRPQCPLFACSCRVNSMASCCDTHSRCGLALVVLPSAICHNCSPSIMYPSARCCARRRSRLGLVLSRLHKASMTSRKRGSCWNRVRKSVMVESVTLIWNKSLTKPCAISQSSLTDQALPSPSIRGRPDAWRLRESAAVFEMPGRCHTSVM